jgi:YggT family protein
MFVFGHLLTGLAVVLDWVFVIYQWILIARAVLSWVNPDPRNPIVQFLYAATEPPIRTVRRLLPMNLRYFPLDIAFMVVFGIVLFMRMGVVPALFEMGLRLRATSAP